MKKTFLACLVLLCTTGFSQYSHSDTASVRSAMSAQAMAWNKGDLEGFMQGYWKSDSLRFIGSKGITYGWQQTLANYKKGYPTKEAMGELSFDIKSIESLSRGSIFVVGKWHLQKKGSEAGGYYTLLWKKVNGKWVIVLDHTS